MQGNDGGNQLERREANATRHSEEKKKSVFPNPVLYGCCHDFWYLRLPATDRAPGVGGCDPAAEAAALRRAISAASRAENCIDGILGYLKNTGASRQISRPVLARGCTIRAASEGGRRRVWWRGGAHA